MKLLEEEKKVKKWGIKFVNTEKGIELWGADIYNQSLLAPMAIFYHNSGGIERFEKFRDALEAKGYNPKQHGENFYLKDGTIGTVRDKYHKEGNLKLGKRASNSLLFPIILWVMKSVGVLKRS